MKRVTDHDLSTIEGGEIGKLCGAAAGLTLGAFLLWGPISLAYSLPKAINACIYDAAN